MAQGQEYHGFQQIAIPVHGRTRPNAEHVGLAMWSADEAEVSNKLGAEKHEQSQDRTSHRCGFRPRRLDTRLGTIYLPVPKVRNGGNIAFFVTERKRSEAAPIQVVQEAFVQGVSNRKMEKPVKT